MERLADHVDLLTGFPFKSASYTSDSSGTRLVRGDNVVQGQLRWENAARWPDDEQDGIDRYQLEPGDVVLAMDRPWIEAGLKYARIGKDDVPALLVQRVARLRAHSDLHQGFLFYLIGSQGFTDHVLAVQTGTAVPHISGKQILEFQFRLPSYTEQEAIAALLGSLDDKIEQNRRTARVLERLARAIFKAWFVDFEPVKAKAAGAASFPSMPQPTFDALPTTFTTTDHGPVPEGWKMGSLGDVIDIHDARRVPLSKRQREERRGVFRYYGAAGVVGHVDGYLFDGCFTLVGEDGTVYGDGDRPMTQYVWGQFWVNNHAHVLTGRAPWTTEHIYVLLQHVYIRPFVTGAVQPKLNQGNLKSVPIVMPPDPVAGSFGDIVEPLFQLLRHVEDESAKLADMRDLLLPRLLSGSIRAEVDHG
ncbi:MAG: restriction endonuclease subunit S [Planctomycetota bacterium]|nr:MAG: restriction endonuclease subunit S [Planctomycetota bacterium]